MGSFMSGTRRGARHGLKATGKLERIAQQEALLLTESRFDGYSHAKKLKEKIVEDLNLNSDSEIIKPKKKKKKRKRCNSNEKQSVNVTKETTLSDSIEALAVQDDDVTSVIKQETVSRKVKKSKRKFSNNVEVNPDDVDIGHESKISKKENEKSKKKKKKAFELKDLK